MRPLAPDEAALWERVAQTVTPLGGRRAAARVPAAAAAASSSVAAAMPPRPKEKAAGAAAPPPPARPSTPPPPSESAGLDAGWDRRLGRGAVSPDFSLDLHGCTLDAAHARLDHGLTLAQAQGARVVLLVTGRARPVQDHAVSAHHGRGERRGAIRAKFLDWLLAGPHARRIAAVRPAHPRHGGAGAVYLVLRRVR